MVTRRAFLAGSAAAVVAGAVGVELVGRDRLLRRLGLSESPDRAVAPSGWHVERSSLASPHANGDVHYAMTRPPGSDPLAAALICLHGRGEDHRFAFDVVHVHDFVAEAGLPFGVASVDGGDHSYWHARRDGTDMGAMVVDDFIPLVQRELRVDTVAVVGWSMGGYGALLAAERHPDRFAAVVVASPALFDSPTATPAGAFDGPDDFEENDVFAGASTLDPTRLRIDCGIGDPFYEASKRFAARLGPTVTTSFTHGYHDASFWRSVAPAQVQFIASVIR